MKVKIREYQPSDKTGVKKCINELKNYESLFDEDYLTGRKAVEALFKNLLRSRKTKDGQIFVAEVNDKVVGFISLEIENKNDELIVGKVNSVYISDLVVLSKYRRRGIGKKLLQKADEYAKKKNISFIKLIVFSDNKEAKRFYKKAGFRNYESTLLKKI